MLENMKVSELRDYFRKQGKDPTHEIMSYICMPESYEEFIDYLYRDIEEAILELEGSRNYCAKDSEERLTLSIVSFLKANRYLASSEENQSGHCDLTVKLKGYTWLGEAKIYSSPSVLFKGFKQLTTRYSAGTYQASCGGLLIYIRKQNACKIMSGWSDFLRDKQKDVNINICSSNNPLRFITTHVHSASGLDYTVKHMGVVMHFDPKDRK